MDPINIIAIFFMVGMTLTGVLGPRNIVSAISQRPVPKPTPEIEGPKPVWYDCVVSTERIGEQRLVDGGVMDVKDMTICDALGCPNCMPTRLAILEEERIAANQKFLDARRDLAKRRAANKALQEKSMPKAGPSCMDPTDRRYSIVKGFRILRAPGVPEFAYGVLDYDPSMRTTRVLWKWDYGDGTVYAKTQNLTLDQMPVAQPVAIGESEPTYTINATSITAGRIQSPSIRMNLEGDDLEW